MIYENVCGRERLFDDPNINKNNSICNREEHTAWGPAVTNPRESFEQDTSLITSIYLMQYNLIKEHTKTDISSLAQNLRLYL